MHIRAFILVSVLLLVFSCRIMFAQGTITVTASVIDSDSQTWNNGACSAAYDNPNPKIALTNTTTGATISPQSVSCTLSNSGAFSITLVSTANIYPAILGVKFTVCSQVQANACYTTGDIVINTSGPQSVSTQINAVIQPPRVTGGALGTAYADVEVPSLAGNQYYNVTSNTFRCYTTLWGQCGGSGSGTVGNCATIGGIAYYAASGTTIGCNAGMTFSSVSDTVTIGNVTLNGTNGGVEATDAGSGFVDTDQLCLTGSSCISAIGSLAAYNTSGTLASGRLLVGTSSTNLAAVAVSGDWTITTAGVTTNTGLNGVSLATYFASPPVIGGTTPANATFAALTLTGNLTMNGSVAIPSTITGYNGSTTGKVLINDGENSNAIIKYSSTDGGASSSGIQSLSSGNLSSVNQIGLNTTSGWLFNSDTTVSFVNGFGHASWRFGYLTTYSTLPACSSVQTPSEYMISDANTNALGATVSSGGGSFTVELYCNGTSWFVIASLTSSPVFSGTTGSIGGSALAAGACTSGTVSITGATTSMGVVATPTTYPGDGTIWDGYVSASGTVTVKVCAIIAATPVSSTYNVRVLQ